MTITYSFKFYLQRRQMTWQLLLASVLLCCAVTAHAQLWSFSQARTDWKSLGLGITGGIIFHELGHVVIAKSKGYNIDNDGLSIIYPDSDISDSGRLQVSSAGFQFQWLLSELVFRRHQRLHPDETMDNLSAGAILSHIGISAAYLTFLKSHRNGDINGMAEATDLSRDQVALLVAIPAALDTWRLFAKKPPKWLPRVSQMSKGLGITAIWTF